MKIPRPFGLLLQFDGAHSADARSQLFKDAARSAFGQFLSDLPVVVKVKRYIGYPDWDHPSASSFVYAADDQSVQRVGTALGLQLDAEPQVASHASEHITPDLKFYSAQPRRGLVWGKDQEIVPHRYLRYGSLTGVYLQDALIVSEGSLSPKNKRRRKTPDKQDASERPVTRSQG